MAWKWAGLAVLLAFGFMFFRPRHRTSGHGYKGSDPKSIDQGENRSNPDSKRGGGCCG